MTTPQSSASMGRGREARRRGAVVPDPNAMTFGEHLEDLRRRLILSILGLVPIAVVALVFGVPVLEFLMAPVLRELRDRGLPANLMAAAPGESFGAYLWVAVGITLVVGAPWVFFQLWMFVAPGLLRRERRLAYFLLPLSGVLTASGLALLWVYMLPLVLAFFIGFGSDIGRQKPTVAPAGEAVVFPSFPVLGADPPEPTVGQAWVNTELMQLRVCIDGEGGARRVVGSPLTEAPGIIQQYRVTEYIRLLLSLSIAFVVGFQTPIVVLLLGWAGIIDVQTLAKHRRMAIMLCAVAGSVLTPADPISLFFLAVPLYLLYELGAIMLRWLPPGRVMGKENDAGEE